MRFGHHAAFGMHGGHAGFHGPALGGRLLMIFLIIIGAVVAGIIARFVTMDWLRKQYDGSKTYAAGILAFLVTMLIVLLAGIEII